MKRDDYYDDEHDQCFISCMLIQVCALAAFFILQPELITWKNMLLTLIYVVFMGSIMAHFMAYPASYLLRLTERRKAYIEWLKAVVCNIIVFIGIAIVIWICGTLSCERSHHEGSDIDYNDYIENNGRWRF